MKAEINKCYWAKVKYHEASKIALDAIENGEKILVKAAFIAESWHMFAGEMIFFPKNSKYYLSERDLELLEETTCEE